MLPYTVIHEAKSKYAYLFDKDTVHLRLAITKGHVNTVRVIYGDPFRWGPSATDPETWEWHTDSTSDSIMIKEYETEQFDHFFFAATPPTKRMKYAFILDERYLFGTRETIDIIARPDLLKHHFNYFNFPFLNDVDLFQAPSWVKDTIWYAIFPERFRNGDTGNDPDGTLPWGSVHEYSNRQHFGGDLQGVIDALDYIQSIGFTGIYLKPIFPSDSTHKYDVNDYYDIDPQFGDKAVFRTLVDEAHKRGIKVMLDAVYNHCGFRHPFFQDVVKHGKDSMYYDAFYVIDDTKPIINFDVDDDGRIIRESARHLFRDKSLLNYRTFAFTPYMPKIKADHPLWKEHLLGAATYWIDNFAIDGWRLDVSNEVSHAFWRAFRNAVKAADPAVYITGENWDNAMPWLGGDQYDGVMNYELLFPLWSYFGTTDEFPRTSGRRFMYKVNQVLTQYPKNVLPSLYNLVDSHDTTRILQICGNNKDLVKLPYVFLFTFPGSPSVYYGGEVGLSGKHDPDNRRCMIWDEASQDKDMLAFIKRLIGLRKQHPSFRSVDITWLTAADELLIYRKDDLTVFLHNGDAERTIDVPAHLRDQTVIDLYADHALHLTDVLTLPPYGLLLLQTT